MTEHAGAGAAAPDPSAVVTSAPDIEALADALAAATGIPREDLPSAADLIAAVTGVAGGPGIPLTAEERDDAARAHAEMAMADYDQAMASAAHTREHAQSLLEAAEAAEAKAEADRDRGLANADRIRTGDPAEGPPPGEPPPDEGPPGNGELAAEADAITETNGTGA